MAIFSMAGIYQSEYDKFQKEIHARHPEWERAQRDGLNLSWNRTSAGLISYGEAGEKKKAYPYDVNFQ
ncbi:MAG: DUF3460 family protein [Candidatus Accumulibacter sp.]|jgi:hypothetical protein|nr:DUF3460 family protein [Accumulibacter sp.]